MNAEIEQLDRALDAALKDFEPATFCWIEDAETGEEDGGENYCYDCAQIAAKAHEGNWEVRVGIMMETDSIPYCDTCGTLLKGSCLESGAEMETECFEERSPLVISTLEDAWILGKIINWYGCLGHTSPNLSARIEALCKSTRVEVQVPA